jgi:hypothetical protein
MIMQCDRKGCENILCERLSDDLGYICNECFEELVAGTQQPKDFMKQEKPKNYESPDRDWCEKIFRKLDL